MCNPSEDSEDHSEELEERSEESEEYDDSNDPGRWTSYQKWSLGLAASGVVIPTIIGAAQFLAAR
ncbi:hypothetical protein [Streptomyces sp. NPDC057253]|uniref:hypothetical protein n=1 Tax=Streptomyces sp. NPDC057253 TaxID=3346069 RepID=UPI0036437E0D